MKRAMNRCGGYILFEVVIAVTIFALAFVGLLGVLRQSQTVSGEFAFEDALRLGLEAILTEARHRELAEMTLESSDEVLGVVYRTEVEPLVLTGGEGENLADLYRLRAEARYDVGRGPEIQAAEIWIYRPAEGNAN